MPRSRCTINKVVSDLCSVALRRRDARLPGVLFLVVCAATLWAQRPTHPLKKFTAPDGAFTFRYSGQLIRCELKKQGTGDGYYWDDPGEMCAAYHPVCDGSVYQDHTPIVCLAYPRNKFTNTAAFEAATFSIEVMNNAATEKDCLAMPFDQALGARQSTTTIHGVSFAVFEFGEGGMNQSVSGHVYRTFHVGKCYQLGINVATAQAQVFDPPARDLTKSDWHEVNGRLEQARDSFQFVK
jgi:hypothetical protein